MRIVAGLGNPGSTYAETRHNIGFKVVEELAHRWQLALGRPNRGLRAARGSIAGQPTLLVEPQLYMNLSGEALARLDPPISARDLIVVHDDLDLECGRLRVKCGGGTAGDQGVESIVNHFGPDFSRVRVGVGRGCRETDTVDHVLSSFDSDELAIITAAVTNAADAVECILSEGEMRAMNRFNTRPHGSPAAGPAPMGRE